MCSGLFSSSANGAIASRASACSGLSTSSRIVRSPCTISGLAGLYCMGSLPDRDLRRHSCRMSPRGSGTSPLRVGEHAIVDGMPPSRKVGFGRRPVPGSSGRRSYAETRFGVRHGPGLHEGVERWDD